MRGWGMGGEGDGEGQVCATARSRAQRVVRGGKGLGGGQYTHSNVDFSGGPGGLQGGLHCLSSHQLELVLLLCSHAQGHIASTAHTRGVG